MNGIKIRLVLLPALMVMLAPSAASAASAAEMGAEIDYLIDSVGRDGCAFIRNERRYAARDARAHLRSKRELNEALFANTEEFIDKIASGSATTGEPYVIRCRNKEWISAEWFREQLEDFRNKNGAARRVNT